MDKKKGLGESKALWTLMVHSFKSHILKEKKKELKGVSFYPRKYSRVLVSIFLENSISHQKLEWFSMSNSFIVFFFFERQFTKTSTPDLRWYSRKYFIMSPIKLAHMRERDKTRKNIFFLYVTVHLLINLSALNCFRVKFTQTLEENTSKKTVWLRI